MPIHEFSAKKLIKIASAKGQKKIEMISFKLTFPPKNEQMNSILLLEGDAQNLPLG